MKTATSKQRILVPLGEGFEEIEAVTIVDVLRRAGLDVTLASLRPNNAPDCHTRVRNSVKGPVKISL